MHPSLTKENPSALQTAVTEALKRIPPLWPLENFVAVNPFIGMLDRTFTEACAIQLKAFGSIPLQSAEDYRAAYRQGTIGESDLSAVADQKWTPSMLVHALQDKHSSLNSGATLTFADALDQSLHRGQWARFVTEEISKWCGVHFDDNQTTWGSPWAELGLFAAWREAAGIDRNPEACGLHRFRAFVHTLPQNSDDTIAYCTRQLASWIHDPADFYHRQLASIIGWASYLQYQCREDELRGRTNPLLRDLLAIRLSYDAALHAAFSNTIPHSSQPKTAAQEVIIHQQVEVLHRWQNAYELPYQKKLAADLCASNSISKNLRASVQAVFCIDVRSEVFRRNLEAASTGIKTIGFAGFFGFPLAHQVPGKPISPRCPVLLVPTKVSAEAHSVAENQVITGQRSRADSWKAFQNSAASCFSFVETFGLTFSQGLATLRKRPAPECHQATPILLNESTEARASLAEGALRNMSLVTDFARIVLLCGHGSQSANNPYASSLACGACGGYAGDVNARIAAASFNDPDVRSLLAERKIMIPADTIFVAGLHNTTTDQVTLFDLEQIPASHQAELERLQLALSTAGQTARQERAPALHLEGKVGSDLNQEIRNKAEHIAEIRPEWGLTGNAAFIAAPRTLTQSLNLQGRAFLHDYEPRHDPDCSVLKLILAAPVVVGSWINLQYYASRVDQSAYGSGNKVLHNVIGGIGVAEGNGGDLKPGLPLQSLHDGEKYLHEPRRLTVYIADDRERVASALQSLPDVRQLFLHAWIHLIVIENHRAHRYTTTGWQSV